MDATEMRRERGWRAGEVAGAAVFLAWMLAYVWVADVVRRGALP